ncbi:EAL domain protein [Bordetella holmesii ATCC 51541]|nr:EAL domain protein [Bordetella holmesii ATCC 51541]AWP93256.1 EAL domain-containing protein [Bordetella holmesii]SUV94756.1 signaling protein [Bordetella holmesii]
MLLVSLPVALVLGCLMSWAVFRLQMQRMSFHDQIHRGMRAGEFHMEYQPIQGIGSDRCEGIEALMRWERPGVGAISPEVFIAAAEAEGAIVPLTRHALRLIERDLPLMGLPPGFHLSVNVAAEHLLRADFPADIEAFAQQVAPNAPHLVLELTERSLVENSGIVQQHIRTLRAAGLSVAIDDFGAGYCSLSYLQQLPVDYLKIDKVFIDAITDADQDSPILELILALASRLGLSVVAEGVSAQTQLDYLRQRGVGYVQGFLVSPPLRAAEFAHWYRVKGHRPLA